MTITRAFPEMMRFLLGTSILFAGFVFCGWLVLGPYHIKVSNVKIESTLTRVLYGKCF